MQNSGCSRSALAEGGGSAGVTLNFKRDNDGVGNLTIELSEMEIEEFTTALLHVDTYGQDFAYDMYLEIEREMDYK